MRNSLPPTTPTILRNADFRAIVKMVYDNAGISLADSKKNLVVSRLSGRLRRLGITRFSDYVSRLQSWDTGKDELHYLINAITTNTTHFFRENHHFIFLQRYLHDLATQKAARNEKKIRIWCAASSTGQEPYSIAMTVCKVFGSHPDWDIKLLASDIDTNVLTVASRGEYSPAEMSHIPPDDVARYFNQVRNSDSYRVKDSLRRLIIFRRVNLIYDELRFNEPLDIVFCRNVMIYFSAENRTRLLGKIHHTLAPNGILFLGHSESIQLHDRKYDLLDTTVYRKKQYGIDRRSTA